MVFSISPNIVSKLGSTDSIIPMAVKDSFNIAGSTYQAYKAGGYVEATDKGFDETGTGVIWAFGIPANKKFIDWSLYEKAGISPAVDPRVVKDNDYFKKALEFAPNDEIKQNLKKAGNSVGKTKALAITKFAAAMAMTMLEYAGFTKLKQKITRLNIEKEFNKKMEQQEKKNKYNKDVFSDFNAFGARFKSNPSFGSSDFIYNPVKNMALLDLGITGTRLKNARTDGEFKEYAIKEGSFLFFAYVADKFIKKGLEHFSKEILKMPVALDAKFLSSKLSEDVLTNNLMQKEIKDFNEKFGKEKNTNNIYDFLFKNQDNTIVKAAKKSGIIATAKDEKGKAKINTASYIDTDEIKNLGKKLQEYIDYSKSFDIKKYINKIKSLKIATTGISIGSCCLALGYCVPKAMYNYRNKHQDGCKDFHVRTEYEKELMAKRMALLQQ